MLDTLQSTQVAALNRRSVPILGACLELGAGTRGTLMGPMALRTAGIARVLADLGHAVSDRGTLWEAEPVDPGVAPQAAGRCRHLAEIAGWTRRLHDHAYGMAAEGAVPVFLGGDHSISMGTVSGVARRCREQGRELAILWIDAHADYNTPETSPSGNVHGMALSFLAGEESLRPVLASRPFHPVPPGNIHLFGARSIDAGEKARLVAHGVDTVDMRQIDERGVSALLAERITGWRARGVHLHVSFDVDFLDPAVAPGTGTVVPGGATYREAHLVMEMLCDSGLVGSVDVVELNPFLDERGRTAVAATELVASLFGRTV
ncbi:arginase, partial [Amaricoccus sp.]|uniref:arginase n=1 Tax=Amaricoccus sp. TaxID=1872485 RepID=UPI00261A9884